MHASYHIVSILSFTDYPTISCNILRLTKLITKYLNKYIKQAPRVDKLNSFITQNPSSEGYSILTEEFVVDLGSCLG